MARPKRTLAGPKRALADADLNAEPAPVTKKASKGRGKAKGKENEVPAAKKAVTANDKAAEKEAPRKTSQKSVKGHAPASRKAVAVDSEYATQECQLERKAKDKKADQSSATRIVDAASTSKAASTSNKGVTAKAMDDKVPEKADGKTWICICNPTEDLDKEFDVDEEDVSNSCGRGKNCMCMRVADHHPNHKWIVTKKGFDLLQEWNVQQAKRDQDSFDMYIFNDFSGYGTCEVIENMFLAFAKEEKKKSKDPLAMWSIIESVALFFTAGDLMTWHMCPDSEGNAKRVMLIGTMLLTTIDILIGKGLFVNDGLAIRNIGLILSQYLQFAVDEDETCQFNENGWKAVVVAKADMHNIALQGLAGIDMIVDGIRSEDEDSESDGDDEPDHLARITKEFLNLTICYKSRELWGILTIEKLNSGDWRTWKRWHWAIELASYTSTQAVKVGPTGPSYGGKIGGNFYDLTTKRNKGPHMKRYKLGEGM